MNIIWCGKKHHLVNGEHVLHTAATYQKQCMLRHNACACAPRPCLLGRFPMLHWTVARDLSRSVELWVSPAGNIPFSRVAFGRKCRGLTTIAWQRDRTRVELDSTVAWMKEMVCLKIDNEGQLHSMHVTLYWAAPCDFFFHPDCFFSDWQRQMRFSLNTMRNFIQSLLQVWPIV